MRTEEFNAQVYPEKAILWQYEQADKIISLINAKKAWYKTNHEGFFQDWFYNAFDLNTLNDFGCSVWAIILGVTFQVKQASRRTSVAIGLDYTNALNFDRANFGSSETYFVGMTLEQKRLVLKMRYRQLTSRGTIPEINSMISDIFGPGNGYAIDNLSLIHI